MYNQTASVTDTLYIGEDLKMARYIGLLLCFAAAISIGGCGRGGDGGNMVENAELSEVEAYEASLVEEEAGMDNDFVESEK